jgi:kinesin family protein 2/24
MTLKECIKNRAKSVQDPATYVHIPFRQAKLMLVKKEALELESHKLSRTVVFACVAPTLLDQAMTLNTLRYVAPIKQGGHNRRKVAPDPNNPGNWDNARLRAWVEKVSRGAVKPETLCPWESGRQLLRLPEADFLRRVMEGNPKVDRFA